MKGLLEGCRVLGQRCWACGVFWRTPTQAPRTGETIRVQLTLQGKTSVTVRPFPSYFRQKAPVDSLTGITKNSTQNFIVNLSELQGRYSGERGIRCKSLFAYCTILSTRRKHARCSNRGKVSQILLLAHGHLVRMTSVMFNHVRDRNCDPPHNYYRYYLIHSARIICCYLPNHQRTLCSDLSQGHATLDRGTAKHQHPQDENAKYIKSPIIVEG